MVQRSHERAVPSLLGYTLSCSESAQFFSDAYESLDGHENTEEDEDFDVAFYVEDNPFHLKF